MEYTRQCISAKPGRGKEAHPSDRPPKNSRVSRAFGKSDVYVPQTPRVPERLGWLPQPKHMCYALTYRQIKVRQQTKQSDSFAYFRDSSAIHYLNVSHNYNSLLEHVFKTCSTSFWPLNENKFCFKNSFQ